MKPRTDFQTFKAAFQPKENNMNHDLTDIELKELIQLMPKGRKEWHWINHGENRITDVKIAHNGVEITEAVSQNTNDRDLVIRAAFESLCRRRDRRSKSALKAAKTRKRRRDANIHAIAKAFIEGRYPGPSRSCRVCGKIVTDDESKERGIGPDCWQAVLLLIEQSCRNAPTQ